MTTELEQKQLRTRQYWYVDGTYEFNMAGIFLLLTGYFLLLAKFDGTKFGAILSVAMIVVFVGGMYGVNWLIRLLKTRVTFPRTGYIAYKRESKDKRVKRLVIVGAISGFIAAFISVMISNTSMSWLIRTSRDLSLNWLPGMVGLLMAVAASLFGVRMKIARFYWIAALSVVVGVATMFIPTDLNTGLAIYYGVTGVALLIIGIVIFTSYLRSTTPLAEDDHE